MHANAELTEDSKKDSTVTPETKVAINISVSPHHRADTCAPGQPWEHTSVGYTHIKLRLKTKLSPRGNKE